MQRGRRRAPRRAPASSNERFVSVTVGYWETRRKFQLRGNRPLRDGEYVVRSDRGGRTISAPRNTPYYKNPTIGFDVSRRTASGRKIRKRGIERMFKEVPAGTGAMLPGNMM